MAFAKSHRKASMPFTMFWWVGPIFSDGGRMERSRKWLCYVSTSRDFSCQWATGSGDRQGSSPGTLAIELKSIVASMHATICLS